MGKDTQPIKLFTMNKEEILKYVGFDLDKAKQIYAWLHADYEQAPTPSLPNEVVSIVEQDGKKLVRVDVGNKYHFGIDLHDAPNEMSWDDAKKYAEDKGMRLFTLEEGLLMFCFKDEINAKLKEAGGDELREDDCYWSSTEYSRIYARCVSFSNGYAYTDYKSYGHVVRPVAAFTCVS